MRISHVTSGLILAALTTPALASGYGLREASTVAMGTAYAGAAAQDGDASFLEYNPASLAGVADSDVSVSMIALIPHSDANFPTALTSAGTPVSGASHVGDYVNEANVPAIAYRARLSDRWTVGISVNAPWGLKTQFDSDSVVRYYAEKTRLEIITITPLVAYQVTPNFAVAAGINAQYSKGTLSNAIDFGTIGALNGFPTVPGADDGRALIKNADAWSWGFVLGAMWKPNDNVSIGVSYHSAVTQNLKGPLHFTLDADGVGATLESVTGMFADTQISAKVTTPDVAAVGVRFRLSDRWTALAGADWTNWSRFRSLDVRSANPFQPVDITEADWKDSWFVSGGLEYAVNDAWTLRAGTAYDDTPVPASTREPRIPDNSRFWLAAGFTWHATPALDLSASYAHLFLDAASIDQTPAMTGNAIRGTLIGSSKVNADAVGVELAWRM